MFAGGEPGPEQDACAGNLLLRYVSGVVRPNLVENEALTTSAESVLQEDQCHEQEACPEGNQGGGDE